MASATATRTGVRVRGSCKAGHVTETTADKGRATWQGECSHPGCDLKVNARRIPRDAVPPPPPASEAGGTRVVRIADYDVTSSGAQDDAGGLVVADVAAEPDAGAGDSGADAGGAAADPVDDDNERHGLRDRWRERRRAAAVRSARRDWQHPLGI